MIVVVLVRVMRRMLNWILSLGFVWNLSRQGSVFGYLLLIFRRAVSYVVFVVEIGKSVDRYVICNYGCERTIYFPMMVFHRHKYIYVYLHIIPDRRGYEGSTNFGPLRQRFNI